MAPKKIVDISFDSSREEIVESNGDDTPKGFSIRVYINNLFKRAINMKGDSAAPVIV